MASPMLLPGAGTVEGRSLAVVLECKESSLEKGTAMGHSRYTTDEIAARGKAIYEQQIRDQVEPQHLGKFLILDIETGDYEVDEDEFAASRRAHARHPDGAFFGLRVGYKTSGTIGASGPAAL
jgi:hypothetical protein